ncbi:helix-turn-helix domain-containing protein [Haliangium sp.]|uniref:helix-turn-helix domain-containing protein n=1 Tax=Haliangium sp. TaxID=2663208 RepID=UPI003D13A8A3
MKLSLSQVATLLGSSERQVRYKVKKGELRANKIGKEWRFDPHDLPLTDDQRQRLLERAEHLVQAAEEAAAPAVAASQGKTQYSITDLRVYKLIEPLYQHMVQAWGAGDRAVQCMRRSIELIGRGCHAFHGPEKRSEYAAAREEIASTVVELLLHTPPDDDRRAFAVTIEQTVLGPLNALIRRAERTGRGGRFTQFGGAGARR